MENPDELPDLTPDEERLLNLLVEYDQALADGTVVTTDTHPPAGVNAELADQLVRGKHLLELMATVAESRDDEELAPQRFTVGAPDEPTNNLDDFLSSIQSDKHAPVRLGRFVIERELGVGGHGVVLLAFDPVLKRQVAIKIPRPEATVSAALRRRFVREARAAARLTHPNLVSVYEVGEAGRLGYIAAAYCPGPSLATWLHEQGQPLASRDAARLLVQLADAVHYAHSQGVVHRDIKPSNVLLEPLAQDREVSSAAADDALPFVPKLVDFGMAKLEGYAGSDTISGVAIGTPGYMAPEQVEGRVAEIDARTDVYGLGTVLYETLTGVRPFVAASDAELMRRILDVEPISPDRVRSGIGPDMAAICLKCLEKRPVRRYSTAQALADDLRRYLAGEPIVARPVTQRERLARWARRNPGIAALSSAVLLLLTALALAATVAAVRINRALDLEQDARQQALREKERAKEETARAEAERERAKNFAREARSESETAHSVANYLEGMFRSADPVGIEGFRFRPQVDGSSELTAVDILQLGAERLDADLAEQPAVQAKLMSVIGSVYVTLGMLREAEPLLERSLQIREALFGEDTTQTAESLHNLATLRFATFDFSSTKQLLTRALAIRTKQLGPDHPDTIRTKFNLAWLVVTNGHETRAEKARVVPLMEEVVRYHRRESDSAVRYAFALIGLGMLRYEVEQQPLQAAVLMADANRVFSKNGNSDIGAGFMLMLRSYVQRRVGNGRVAVTSAEAAIERLKKAVGETHPVLVWPHYLWAEALIINGRSPEALDVYRETLALCRRLYDAEHRTIGMTLARMAEPLMLLDQVADAEGVLAEALEIFRRDRQNLVNRASCVRRLSLVLAQQGRHNEAASLCRQEIDAARALGTDPETQAFLMSMLWESAQAEIAGGNWAAAEGALTESATRESSHPAGPDADLPSKLIALARVQLARGKVHEYQETCRRLMNVVGKNASGLELRGIVRTCTLAPGAVDDPERLVAMAERAAARGGPQGDARTVLAAAQFRIGQYDRALERLSAIATANATEPHWPSLAWLALARAQAGQVEQAAASLEHLAQLPPGRPDDSDDTREKLLVQSERDMLVDEVRQLITSHTSSQLQPPPSVR